MEEGKKKTEAKEGRGGDRGIGNSKGTDKGKGWGNSVTRQVDGEHICVHVREIGGRHRA